MPVKASPMMSTSRLINHKGHGISKYVLEDNGKPQPFTAAEFFVHGGNCCQARAVKQVEHQEAERRHRVLEHAHGCCPQACIVFGKFTNANQYADGADNGFLGNKAGDRSRNSLPFAETKRCKNPAIAPPMER